MMQLLILGLLVYMVWRVINRQTKRGHVWESRKAAWCAVGRYLRADWHGLWRKPEPKPKTTYRLDDVLDWDDDEWERHFGEPDE